MKLIIFLTVLLASIIRNCDGELKTIQETSEKDGKKKFPVIETPAECDSFETCSACHSQNNWHSCGWCPIENKCSLEDECSTLNASDIGWQDRNSEYCKITRITQKVPHKLFVYTPGLLSLYISNIDSVNGSLQCLFKINGTNSVTTNTRRKNYGVDCNTPAQEELVPYFPDDGDYLLTDVIVRRTQDDSLVSTTDFLFYDCSSLKLIQYCQWCLPITMCTLEVHSNCIKSPKLPDNASPKHCPKLRAATPEGPRAMLRAVGETIELILTVHVPLPYHLRDDVLCRYSVDGEAVEGGSTIVNSNVSKVIKVHCHEVTLNFTGSWGARNASVELIWKKFSFLYNPDDINIEVYQCEYLGPSCTACSEVPGQYPCGWCSASSACTLQHRCADHQTWITNSTYCPPEPLDDDDDSDVEKQYTVVIVAVLVPIFLVFIAVVLLFLIRNRRFFGKKDQGHLAGRNFDVYSPLISNMNEEEMRVLFLHEYKLDHNVSQAVANINRAWGEGSISDQIVRKWFKKFNKYQERLKDDTERSSTSSDHHSKEFHDESPIESALVLMSDETVASSSKRLDQLELDRLAKLEHKSMKESSEQSTSQSRQDMTTEVH